MGDAAFSPIFRGQPHGTFKLLFNALLTSTGASQETQEHDD